MRYLVGGLIGLTLAVGTWASPLVAQATPAASTVPIQLPPPNSHLVFVNTQRILPDVPGAKEAQAEFNKQVDAYNAEVQTLAAQADSLLADYRRQEAMMTPQAKDQRQQEILAKQQELQKRRAELEQQASQRQQELLAPILDKVRAMIETIRAENHYTIVLDSSPGSALLAADPSLDITQAVLARLKAESAQTAAKPGSG